MAYSILYNLFFSLRLCLSYCLSVYLSMYFSLFLCLYHSVSVSIILSLSLSFCLCLLRCICISHKFYPSGLWPTLYYNLSSFSVSLCLCLCFYLNVFNSHFNSINSSFLFCFKNHIYKLKSHDLFPKLENFEGVYCKVRYN